MDRVMKINCRLTPEQRTLRARNAALAMHAQGKTNTQPATAANLARFADVEERRLYMQALAGMSAEARAARPTRCQAWRNGSDQCRLDRGHGGVHVDGSGATWKAKDYLASILASSRKTARKDLTVRREPNDPIFQGGVALRGGGS